MFNRDPKKRILMRYYKRRLYGGRTAAARAIDFFTLRLVAFAAFCLWFSTRLDNTVLTVLLSAVAVLTLCVMIELINSIRLERFIIKERARLRTRAFTEELMMLDDGAYLHLIEEHLRLHPEAYPADCSAYPVRSAQKLTEDDLVAICRKAKALGKNTAYVFSATEADPKALAAVERYAGVKLEVIGPEKLMADRDAPTESETDELILGLVRQEKEDRKKIVAEPFKSSRVRRYVLVGTGLFILSFFVEYSLLYRLLAGACVSFGALAWWAGGVPVNQQAKQ